MSPLLLIIINSLPLINLSYGSMLNKCCNRRLIKINTTYYKCVNGINITNKIENQFSIKTNIMQKQSDKSDQCIDIINNNLYILTKINNSFIDPRLFTNFTRKCCPNNFFYIPHLKSCTNSSSNRANKYDNTIIKIGLRNCAVVFDRFLGPEEYFTRQGFPKNEQSCIDETVDGKQVVRFCGSLKDCDGKKCVKKCCADGQSFVNGSHCKDTYIYGLSLAEFHSFLGEDVQNLPVMYGYPGMIYIHSNISQFHLDEKGYFHNTKTNEIFRHPNQPYCLEHTQKGSLNKYIYFGFLTKEGPPLSKKFLWNRGAMIVSSGFLAFTIFFYVFSKETKNIFGKTLVSFCISLLLLFVLLIYHTYDKNLHLKKTKGVCKCLGFFIIYLGFCSFMWLQLMCYDIHSTFSKTSRYIDKTEKQKMNLKKFIFYNLYAWGIPFLFTNLLLIFHLTDVLPKCIQIRMGITKCGIEKGNYSEIVFRAFPLTLIQIINSIYFARTIKYVLKVKREIKRMVETPTTVKKKKKFFARRQRFGLVVKLSFTMGIFCFFEVITSFYDFNQHKFTNVLEIVWDFINCLQGLYIFLIFVCKRKYYDKLKKWKAVERMRRISLTSVKTTTTIQLNQL